MCTNEGKTKQFNSTSHTVKKQKKTWGTWVAQWIEHPTLGFSSGPDLRVLGWSHRSGSMLCSQGVWRLSLPLPLSWPVHMVSLSLINKQIFKKTKTVGKGNIKNNNNNKKKLGCLAGSADGTQDFCSPGCGTEPHAAWRDYLKIKS